MSTILWRRLDLPGHEWARVEPDGGGWSLHGCAVLACGGLPYRLEYRVACDDAWRTRAAQVSGWAGPRPIVFEITSSADGRWQRNGTPQPAVAGCTDVDFGFSPSTNLLPIRRLALAVGHEAEVRAAWLRFPGFEFVTLEQTYRRLDVATYRYESAGGRFTADLTVNHDGMVVRYPGLWEMEAEA